MKTLYYDLFQDCYINFVKAQEIFFNHLICIDEQSEGIVNSYVRLNVPCAFRKPDENDREITVTRNYVLEVHLVQSILTTDSQSHSPAHTERRHSQKEPPHPQ